MTLLHNIVIHINMAHFIIIIFFHFLSRFVFLALIAQGHSKTQMA